MLFFIAPIIFFGCSASSNTPRYGNNTDERNSEDNKGRFSSDEDERSITANEDNFTEYAEEESGDLPSDDNVDISEIVDKYNPRDVEYNSTDATVKEKVLMGIIKYLDTPYKYGGNSKKGIDCSAFTQTIYNSVLSVELLRSARDQFTQGEIISDVDDLQFGDLVFFDTRRSSSPGHVGIYIGDNLFAHASSEKGVTISSMNHSYYQSRFMGGRRIKPEGTF